MKTIIAGSRKIHKLGLNNYKDWHNPEKRKLIYDILDEITKTIEIETIISGHCWGIDELGEEWAKNNNKPILLYPANWDKFGKLAGFKRNLQMAEVADCLICIHSNSSGSKNIISTMERLEKKVISYVIQ